MRNNQLLTVTPMTLQFPFEWKKRVSCYLNLTNHTDNNVAFKVKTTNPANFLVRPNIGLVLARSTSEVRVTMRAQKETPDDMQSKDKFIIQSVIVSPEVTAKEVTHEMFKEEARNRVEQTKLTVTYTFTCCTCL